MNGERTINFKIYLYLKHFASKRLGCAGSHWVDECIGSSRAFIRGNSSGPLWGGKGTLGRYQVGKAFNFTLRVGCDFHKISIRKERYSWANKFDTACIVYQYHYHYRHFCRFHVIIDQVWSISVWQCRNLPWSGPALISLIIFRSSGLMVRHPCQRFNEVSSGNENWP